MNRIANYALIERHIPPPPPPPPPSAAEAGREVVAYLHALEWEFSPIALRIKADPVVLRKARRTNLESLRQALAALELAETGMSACARETLAN